MDSSDDHRCRQAQASRPDDCATGPLSVCTGLQSIKILSLAVAVSLSQSMHQSWPMCTADTLLYQRTASATINHHITVVNIDCWPCAEVDGACLVHACNVRNIADVRMLQRTLLDTLPQCDIIQWMHDLPRQDLAWQNIMFVKKNQQELAECQFMERGG